MKQAIAVVVAVLLVVGGVIYGISRTADVSPLDQPTPEEERQAAQAWETEAIGAFGGADLTNRVIEMVEGARKWLAGERSTEEFAADLAARQTQFGEVRTRLKELRDYPYDDRVVGLYRSTADLYTQVVAVYQAMIMTPPGETRTQLDLLARRVRILGDRVFDRGHALVKPKLHEPDRPDVDIRLPAEVPNWVEEGIAPGPPVAPTPPPATKEPQLRKPTRPTQARAAWLTKLASLPIPGRSAVASLFDTPSAPELMAFGIDFNNAAMALRDVPVPDGDREEADRIALSLLVDGEAVRAAQLGLKQVALALQDVSEDLWFGKGLPPR